MSNPQKSLYREPAIAYRYRTRWGVIQITRSISPLGALLLLLACCGFLYLILSFLGLHVF